MNGCVWKIFSILLKFACPSESKAAWLLKISIIRIGSLAMDGNLTRIGKKIM